MDVLEIEALLIRKEAVLTQRQLLDWDAIDMLAAILLPHEDVLQASRERAEETGPSALALRIAGKDTRRRKVRLSKTAVEVQQIKESLGSVDGTLAALYS